MLQQFPSKNPLIAIARKPHESKISSAGFTLIELSIVIVIIGLIIGAIMTGQSLVDSAAQRAQITQIDKYNSAVHAFEAKYNFLPGDIPNPYATQDGFITRGCQRGGGDGNGLIEGNTLGSCPSASGSLYGQTYTAGETLVFWVDLSTAGMIDGSFTAGTNTTSAGYQTTVPGFQQYFPRAKIGGGNFVLVWSGGWLEDCCSSSYPTGDQTNYLSVQTVGSFSSVMDGSALSMTVNQAANIDKKMDDGYPQSGNVMAMYLDYRNPNVNGAFSWAAGSNVYGASGSNEGPATTPATTGYASTNCYDTSIDPGGTGTENYSIAKNGNRPNCALSFNIQ